ncbi:MAG: MoaD/ThiS family protein [Anaerolineales bacterium]
MIPKQRLPILVKTSLLPFRDVITYDGLLNSFPVFFGGGIKSRLRDTYNRLKRREGIIESLTGADGNPQIRTTLDKKRATRKPPPDFHTCAKRILWHIACRCQPVPGHVAKTGGQRRALQKAQIRKARVDPVEKYFTRGSVLLRLIKVHLHLHGILRDKLPPEAKGRASVELPEGVTVSGLLAYLDITRRVVVAVNEEEESDRSQILRSGDKVIMFAAISGG